MIGEANNIRKREQHHSRPGCRRIVVRCAVGGTPHLHCRNALAVLGPHAKEHRRRNTVPRRRCLRRPTCQEYNTSLRAGLCHGLEQPQDFVKVRVAFKNASAWLCRSRSIVTYHQPRKGGVSMKGKAYQARYLTKVCGAHYWIGLISQLCTCASIYQELDRDTSKSTIHALLWLGKHSVRRCRWRHTRDVSSCFHQTRNQLPSPFL